MKQKLFNLKSIVAALCLIGSSIMASAQDFEWVKSIGSNQRDEIRDIVVDPAGNTYVTGVFTGSVDFDPGAGTTVLIALGITDAFIAKYTPDGNLIWAKGIGGMYEDRGWGIAIDTVRGHIYVAGNFQDSADYYTAAGSSSPVLKATGGFDAFLAKFDTNGNYVWAISMGSVGIDYGHAVAVDATGNVYITGYFEGTADFDPGSGSAPLTSTGLSDIFLAKYDPAGDYLWAKSMGSVFCSDWGQGVAVDGSGNVYVTGFFGLTCGVGAPADFNIGGTGGMLTSAGEQDVFLAKYDSSGNYLWAKNMGGAGFDIGYAVAADGTDNVYVTGHFSSAMANFNIGGSGDTLYSAGANDVFLAKYDANGNYLWAKGMGGSDGDDYGYGLTFDRAGNVLCTGSFASVAADFNPGGSGGQLSGTGMLPFIFPDIFLAKYDSAGNYIWAKGMGGDGTDQGLGVVVDNKGHIYLAGQFSSFLSVTADFNPGGSGGTLTNVGEQDAFIVKFACNDTISSYLMDTAKCGTYIFNGEVYTETGVYTQIFPKNASGCDSIITLDLIFIPVEVPTITVNEFVLGVVGSYVTYQWIKDSTDIPGATNATYAVTENADYQVRVTNDNGCESTSAVYEVNNVSINEAEGIAQYISVYPNPVNEVIHINSPVPVHVSLAGADGRTLLRTEHAKQVSVKHLPGGIYFLRVSDQEGRLLKVEKLVKAVR